MGLRGFKLTLGNEEKYFSEIQSILSLSQVPPTVKYNTEGRTEEGKRTKKAVDEKYSRKLCWEKVLLGAPDRSNDEDEEDN